MSLPRHCKLANFYSDGAIKYFVGSNWSAITPAHPIYSSLSVNNVMVFDDAEHTHGTLSANGWTYVTLKKLLISNQGHFFMQVCVEKKIS